MCGWVVTSPDGVGVVFVMVFGCILVFTTATTSSVARPLGMAASSSSVSTYLLHTMNLRPGLLPCCGDIYRYAMSGGGKWRRSVVVIGTEFSKWCVKRRHYRAADVGVAVV